jgi:hypothetical protein
MFGAKFSPACLQTAVVEALTAAVITENKDPRIITPIPSKLLERIDDYRFSQRLPSRAAAIRDLIEAGLAVKEKRKSKADRKR